MSSAEGFALVSLPVYCEKDGDVVAELKRRSFSWCGERVRDALGYFCPSCHAVLSLPHVSVGRVFAARARKQRFLKATEVRVPLEAFDVALATHAALGIPPVGDVFALPIHIGLQVAKLLEGPSSSWRRIDGSGTKGMRARPCLSKADLDLVSVLARRWTLKPAEVLRALIVAGWEASQRGFRPMTETPIAPHLTLVVPLTESIQAIAPTFRSGDANQDEAA